MAILKLPISPITKVISSPSSPLYRISIFHLPLLISHLPAPISQLPVKACQTQITGGVKIILSTTSCSSPPIPGDVGPVVLCTMAHIPERLGFHFPLSGSPPFK